MTSAAEGQGDGTVSYQVVENADPLQRQAAISIADQQVTIAQSAAACRYELSGFPGSVPGDGADTDLNLSTHPACTWTAVSDAAWVSVSPAAGKGPARLHLQVLANEGAERPVTIVVGSERVSAVQQPRPGQPAPSPSPVPAPPPAPVPPPGPTPAPAPPAPAPPTPAPPTPAPPTPAPPTPAPPPAPPPPGPPSAPTPVGPITIEGSATAVSGTCPALKFTLAGRIVTTSNLTEFSKGPCKDLRSGVEVEVRGTLMSDDSVRADRVRFEK